jgi:hypothetical protein
MIQVGLFRVECLYSRVLHALGAVNNEFSYGAGLALHGISMLVNEIRKRWKKL